MKKFALVLLFVGSVGFSAYPCSGDWYYCSTVEDVDDFIDDAVSNCCDGSGFAIQDLCGDQDKYVSIGGDGSNSSCL